VTARETETAAPVTRETLRTRGCANEGLINCTSLSATSGDIIVPVSTEEGCLCSQSGSLHTVTVKEVFIWHVYAHAKRVYGGVAVKLHAYLAF
jgi:hypothetical protein